MILKHGTVNGAVKELQEKLNQAGYSVGPEDGKFFNMTDAAVRDLQEAHGLVVDGQVGIGKHAGETIRVLNSLLTQAQAHITDDVVDTYMEAIALVSGLPANNFDRRISDAVKEQQNCDEGQGCRYGGWIDPYLFDKEKFDKDEVFVVPKVGRLVPGHELHQPVHGGTCSPWAGLIVGAIVCVNQDYNFRIGRSGRKTAMSKHDAKVGRHVVPGYGDYFEVHGKLRLEKRPLNVLYQHWDWLNKVNLVEMDHHVILILKVGGEDGLWLEDPHNPGEPLPSGLYRWAADGYYPRRDTDGDGEDEKYYSGTKQTFRRIKAVDACKQKWDFYRLQDMDPDTCSPTDGPWAGREPWPFGLE